MPRIDDINVEQTRFKKKKYRPWNLLDETISTSLPENLTLADNHTSALPVTAPSEEIKTAINWDKTEREQVTNRKQTDNKQITTPTSNNQQIDNKQVTNYKQTDNKSLTKLITNSKQTDNKQITNRKQIDNKNLTTINKLVTEQITDLITNHKQIDNKLLTNNGFSVLVGNEREILIFIYSNCKVSRSKASQPLSLEHISKSLNIAKGTVKTSINRLVIKGYLLRKFSKNGRGGWTSYEIPEHVYTELLFQETDNKSITNHKQTDNKLLTERVTEQITSLSSSSSFNIITTTDTEDEYNVLDIKSLEQIGFTEQHLKQIIEQKKLDLESIQQSINHFAYDYQNGHKKINTSPLNFFMGILKKGNPYISEHYIDPQEEKRKQFLEKCRRQKEEKKEIEKELLNTEYNIWMRQLSKNEQEEIAKRELPDHQKPNWFRYIHDMLEKHFQEKIWPEKRQEAYEKADLPFIPLRDIS